VERREFCLRTAQVVSLVSASELLRACSSPTGPGNAPQLTTIGGAVSGRTITVTIAAASPLAAVGGAALVTTGLGPFLVARTGQNAFSVVTATCTHEDCTISGFENAMYVCPCHGSQFTESGTVVSGPASVSLRQFAAQFTDPTLTWSA